MAGRNGCADYLSMVLPQLITITTGRGTGWGGGAAAVIGSTSATELARAHTIVAAVLIFGRGSLWGRRCFGSYFFTSLPGLATEEGWIRRKTGCRPRGLDSVILSLPARGLLVRPDGLRCQ